MPNGAVIPFTPLVFEGNHFFVLALFEDFSRNFCAGDERVAVRHLFSIGKHQNITKRRGLAGMHIEKIDIDRVALCDAKLSATSFDDCVSHKNLGEKKAAQNSTNSWSWQTET